MTSFAFLRIDDYMAGFAALRDQQFNIPLITAMPKKDKQKIVYIGRNSLSRNYAVFR
jgi:hypothetical protein